MARGWKKFRRQLRNSARKAAPVLSVASKVASFVPGAGTAVAMGLNAASGIASGKKLGRILGSTLLAATPVGSAASTAIEAARGLGAGRMIRGMRAPDPARMLRSVPMLRSAGRSADTLAREVLRRNPGALAGTVSEVAQRTGLTERAVQSALRHGPPLAWSPLSRRAAGLVSRLSSVSPYHFSRDVSGLSADGLTYTVEKGDYPVRIATKLGIPNPNTAWRELVRANPQKKVDPKTGNFATLFAGEVLTLPASWAKPTSSPDLGSAVVLQSKATLAAWAKTDGASAVTLSDYGLRPEDAVPTWSERDRVTLKAFEFARRMSDQSGSLTQAAADELQRWAEQKAAQVVTGTAPIPVPSVPRPSGPVVLPNDVPPPLGSTTPKIPALPAPPAATLPALPAAPGLPAPPVVLMPPDEVLSPPPLPSNDGATAPAPQKTAAKSGGDASTVLAIAGAAAALLFGL